MKDEEGFALRRVSCAEDGDELKVEEEELAERSYRVLARVARRIMNWEPASNTFITISTDLGPAFIDQHILTPAQSSPRQDVGAQCSQCGVEICHSRLHRHLIRSSCSLRCQRRHKSSHLRPHRWCQRRCHQRRHPLSSPLAAEGHHLRRQDQAPEHQHNHRQQGHADGQLDPQSIAQTRGPDAAQDLSGRGHTERMTHIAKVYRIWASTTTRESYHPSATRSSNPSSPSSMPPNSSLREKPCPIEYEATSCDEPPSSTSPSKMSPSPI